MPDTPSEEPGGQEPERHPTAEAERGSDPSETGLAETAVDKDGAAQKDGVAAGLFEGPPAAEQERMVEALLFAAAEPMTLADIARRLPEGTDPEAALAALTTRYAARGVRLERIGAAWAFRTAPDLGFLLHETVREERKLSRAAMETLAVIAYHQPVTRAEIEEIRGVSVSKGTLDLLLDLGWVRLGRRRESPGRPATFVTTTAFLDHFELESTRDLPGLKELRAAGLLQSAAPASQADADLLPPISEEDGED
ncbi:MAG: SMC-Scp complex subunit ScpB [Pseudomonadota bacterium]